MFDQINLDSSVPVYRQIENLVSYAIASGNLKEGDSLPSGREFAEQFKLNQSTILRALRSLEVMGVVRTERGVGVFVEKGAAAKCQKTCRDALVKKLHEIVVEATAAGMSKQDVTAVVQACLKSDSSPYSPVPQSFLQLF